MAAAEAQVVAGCAAQTHFAEGDDVVADVSSLREKTDAELLAVEERLSGNDGPALSAVAAASAACPVRC